MLKIQGTYAQALVFTDLVEESAVEQIKTLCDQPFVQDCRIRVMPDVHSGSGCVIGFTADLGPLVIPNIVGVDIGCGMLTVALGKTAPDYELLDRVIHRDIPAGANVYPTPVVPFPMLRELFCLPQLRNLPWIECSVGTLGGGNHFIEVDRDDGDNYYLVIHTGSRNLGKQVAELYQQLAIDKTVGRIRLEEKRRALVAEYKAAGRETELQQALQQIKQDVVPTPKELCYLSGKTICTICASARTLPY